VDDYLKAILELSGRQEQRVTSNALAQQIGVRAASVTGMLQKLAVQKPAFVKYEKHHGVRLTAAGKMRALEVLRHHRLLERFLHDVLDYSWDEVHDDAERLEHFISERLEDRIAAKLGDPETDPHGHLIPERNGALPARQEVLLSQWACGIPAVISSVSDRDAAALREMTRLGLKPGVAITVESGMRSDSVRVRIGGRADAVRLRQALASGISVIPGLNDSAGKESRSSNRAAPAWRIDPLPTSAMVKNYPHAAGPARHSGSYCRRQAPGSR
jgi:DtxR family Mn-dependent transcriptional regulator